MAEEIILEILPWFFGGIAFRCVGWGGDKGDVMGYFQVSRIMPSRPVGDHGGMDVRRQRRADLVQMPLHHLGVCMGEHQSDGGIALWTKRTKDISVCIARIDGNRGPGTFGSPTVGTPPFLAHTRFVLAPEFNGFIRMCGFDGCKFQPEFF